MNLLGRARRMFSALLSSEFFWRIARFVFAGGMATAVSAVVLHTSISYFGLWYITGSILGFFAGFFVSFTLQKFWAFRDTRRDVIARQMSMYFVLLIINAGTNTLLVYLMVEFGGLMPVVAQLLSSAIIACQNFLVYHFVIFRTPENPTDLQSDSGNS
ncbi:GtrA family protein [Candidatus Kaiserbacteria bacterium]|nr:GtrA family protein [Candidatus Kaiserbacteria bacterium]